MFASSPKNIVDVPFITNFISTFKTAIAIHSTGPSTKPPTITGSSDKSIFINDGAIGNGKSKYISIALIAENNAIIAIFFT